MYKPGLENKGEYALSRMYEEGHFQSLVHCPTWLECDKIINEVHKDDKLKPIIVALQQGTKTKKWFSYSNDVLSYFVVEYDEVLSNEFPRCKRRSHVPAEAPLDYTAPGAGYNNLIQVIDRGFEFRYDVSQDCTRCLGSEGECWSDCNDIDQNVLSCYYCPDGSHGLHCSPSKSMPSILLSSFTLC